MDLVLLSPGCLPATLRQLRQAPVGCEVHDAAALFAGGGADEPTLLAALSSLPSRPEDIRFLPAEAVPAGRVSQLACYDRFFGVSRVSGAPHQMFAHSMLMGYRGLVREVWAAGTSLTAVQWRLLRAGMQEAVCFAVGVRSDSRPPSLALSVRRVDRGVGDPHQRWRIGHHVFFCLTQAVTVGLNCFLSSLAGRDRSSAARALEFATTVLRASRVALRFAADMSPEDYELRVRPSMPDGFSGLMSADHAHLVGVFRAVGRVLEPLPPTLHGPRAAFLDAVAAVYEAHQGVCARFDGDRAPSLRMGDSCPTPAAEVVGRLGRSRLRLFEMKGGCRV